MPLNSLARAANGRNTDEMVVYMRHCMSQDYEYADGYKIAKWKSRDLDLRINPSTNLPFCPILNTYKALELFAAGPRSVGKSAGVLDTFAGVGSIRHELCQNYMGRGKQFLGNWRCPACNHVMKFCTYRLCTKCGMPPNYEEIRLEASYKGHVVKSLKMDGIFIDKDKQLWIMDFKFVQRHRFSSWRGRKPNFPDKKHVKQIRDYVHTLRELRPDLADRVKGYRILYVPFDEIGSIRTFHVHKRTVSHSVKTAQRYRKWVRRSYKRLILMRQIVGEWWSLGVEIEGVKAMVSSKPCASIEEYEESLHDQYNPCPYAADGSCFASRQKFVKRLFTEYQSALKAAKKLKRKQGAK